MRSRLSVADRRRPRHLLLKDAEVTTSELPRKDVVPAVAALSFVAVASYGSRGSLGLFIQPWQEAFDVSRGSVSLVSSVSFLAFGLAQPVAGRLLATWTARQVLVAGVLFSATGFFFAAFAHALWLVVLLIGVVASFGAGLASLSALSFVAGEIVHKKYGAVVGILTAAAAGGQVLVLPVSAAALSISLKAALMVLGVLLGIVAILLLAFVRPTRPVAADPLSTNGASGMLREPRFWLLLVPFFICGYTTTGLTDTHLIPYAVDHHISKINASAALATLGAFNVMGVLLAGWLTDRVDRGRMLALTYAFRAGLLLCLPFLTSPAGLFLFAALFGLADFSTVPPTTSLTRTTFSQARWALAIGVISGGHQLGSALGAYSGGLFFDLTGSYFYPFLLGAIGLLLAALLSFGLRDQVRTTISARRQAIRSS